MCRVAVIRPRKANGACELTLHRPRVVKPRFRVVAGVEVAGRIIGAGYCDVMSTEARAGSKAAEMTPWYNRRRSRPDIDVRPLRVSHLPFAAAAL